MKTYNTAEVELILEWVARYFQVSALINGAFSNHSIESCPCTPSIENEIEYQRQRIWFRNNHNGFVPIWKDFCLSNGISINIDLDIDRMGYIEDPFFYYFPNNLYELPYWIGSCSADYGYWGEEDRELVLCTNRRFSRTAIYLAHWIGEFADVRSQTD